ncbi:ABC transporter substrate-binding protein [Agrobacterium tumefaciens]|uniref:ABC transporter substrate-binding protein n=1 Tax=Agrobacterium tumefaciens TaxID=358 RepID=UPI0015745449|nr:extracellular solute-binding protein [Agrobacterium tumefaciens]NTD87699.1 extracellular solute-binding protein [Agrobacterium tumefaciens]NTD91574.1 extracellular solute-binding protein [Agrobacterium tumefaciens]NTD95559.1 extracellular solute-binding protein [Agrobacterium tumefaciens]NTE11669.1 extracellular solute-binding protein [Agrobacterium tumefaciens]NTE25114.1 extracellular solute-binding protein [Agrobacterium tumefaciens]
MHENFKLTRRSLVGGLAAASVVAGVGIRKASAQAGATTEVSYNGFLDPANAKDPRAAAQNRMIEAFEKANPSIKIKVIVDPAGSNGIRAVRARSGAPDVIRVSNSQQPEYLSTGSILPIDELVARDGVDTKDWLIPLEQTKFNGKLWGLQQDYRIPILIYRKSRFADAQVTAPPRTYDEVAALGSSLTKGSTIGFAVPIGTTGGIGGAQAFNEFITSSILAGNEGPIFAPDGRDIAFADERLLLAVSTVSDLFAKKASTPVTLQYGYNELQDGLRSGTVASASFGLYRYKGIESTVANKDLAWAPAPTIAPGDKLTAYGFQLCINANSPNKDAAWEFVKFMASPQAQALAARGGEVVARASVYNDPYFSTPEAADQVGWKKLVQERGRLVTYSVIQSVFNQIAGEEFQRMILRGSTPESVVSQIKSRYAEALSKS